MCWTGQTITEIDSGHNFLPGLITHGYLSYQLFTFAEYNKCGQLKIKNNAPNNSFAQRVLNSDWFFSRC
jgi:hypothetical protein